MTLDPIETLFAKGPLVGWQRVNASKLFSRAVFYDLDGQPIERGGKIKAGRRVPALFSGRIISGDLIPATSWGSSLANLLTKTNWQAFRLKVIERNSGVCECCGKLVGSSLEAHEIWSYSDLATDDELKELGDSEAVFGTQTLMGFLGLCAECHICYHLGLADLKGVLDQSLERIAIINGWSDEAVDGYYQELFARHEILSRHYWALNLSIVSDYVDGLVIAKSWGRDEISPTVLRRSNDYGESITVLKNCKWRFANEKEYTES